MSSHLEACGSPVMWPIQPCGSESPKGQALASPISLAPSLIAQIPQPVSSVRPLVVHAIPATSFSAQNGGSDNALMVRTSRLGHAITIASSPITVPLVEVKTPAVLRQPIIVASSTTSLSETKARELTALIGSVADLVAALPDNMPSVLASIMHEYRLNLSLDSLDYINKLIGNTSVSRSVPGCELTKNNYATTNWCSILIQLIETNIDSIKKLIEMDPTQGYALLAGLIATKCIDLVAFGITAKDIVGLAPHMLTQEGVTFDTHLVAEWEESVEVVNRILPGRNKKQAYDNMLIEILHFADLQNLKQGGRDKHLVGKACDNTRGFVSCFMRDCVGELSRFQGRWYWFSSTVESANLLGRSSRELYGPYGGGPVKHVAGVWFNKLKESKFFETMTENSVLNFTESRLWEFFFKESDTLLAKFQGKENVFERVLVNTYREFQERYRTLEINQADLEISLSGACYRYDLYDSNMGPYLKYIRVYQGTMENARELYNKMYGHDTSRSFDDLLRETPLRSTAPIQYERALRSGEIVSAFYDETLEKAARQASA